MQDHAVRSDGGPGGRPLSSPSRLILALSFGLIALIGIIDYGTGYEFSIALLYFLPLSIASLLVSRGAGIAAAVFSAAVWLSAESLTSHPYEHPFALYWNSLVRLGIFLTVSLLFSRLRATAARERAQRKKLEELNELKNSFVGMAAHDLRSPLAVISIYTDYMLDDKSGRLTEQQARFLGVIRSKTAHMLDMIDDLLDITRIESGRLDLKLEPQDYGAFLSQVVELAGVIAGRRGTTFRLHLEDGLPEVTFDRSRVEQVIDNILMNALKYSPAGSTVTVRASHTGNRVVTEVTDQGQGIPPDEIGKLFVEFSTTSVRPAEGDKSTGLGLAIARKIVESHGGEIGVASRVGEGTTFRFTLPATVPSKRTSAAV